MYERVISIHDDGDCPTVGTVFGEIDDEFVFVAWGDERFESDPTLTRVARDELITRR